MEDLSDAIAKIIDRQEICFLSFMNPDGYPTSRAMLNPRKRQGLKEFYLTTNYSSQKTQSLMKDSRAGLYFCDKTLYCGVAFEGEVEVIRDQSIKDQIWRNMDIIFYENNTDPDYCVLKFTAKSARYYQNYHSTDIDL